MIAIAFGAAPTLIALPAALVTVLIGVTMNVDDEKVERPKLRLLSVINCDRPGPVLLDGRQTLGQPGAQPSAAMIDVRVAGVPLQSGRRTIFRPIQACASAAQSFGLESRMRICFER